MWGLDDLYVDTCSEGLKMGYDELLIRRRSRCRQELCELGEAERCEHSREVGIMGKVKVEGLVQWECAGVVVDSDIGLTCSSIQGAIGHSPQELLDISYAHCAAGW